MIAVAVGVGALLGTFLRSEFAIAAKGVKLEREKQGGTQLDGLWSAPCSDHRRRTLQFLAGELTDVVEVFEDEECARKLGTLVRISNYELRGDVLPQQGRRGLVELDLVIRSASWTPEVTRYAVAFNSVGECGLQDWAPGAARSILGLRHDCYFIDSNSIYPAAPIRMPEAGDRLMEVIRLGAVSGGSNLQVSVDFGHVSHSEKRPAGVSDEVFARE